MCARGLLSWMCPRYHQVASRNLCPARFLLTERTSGTRTGCAGTIPAPNVRPDNSTTGKRGTRLNSAPSSPTRCWRCCAPSKATARSCRRHGSNCGRAGTGSTCGRCRRNRAQRPACCDRGADRAARPRYHDDRDCGRVNSCDNALRHYGLTRQAKPILSECAFGRHLLFSRSLGSYRQVQSHFRRILSHVDRPQHGPTMRVIR
jgi:hypothetical protein